MGKYAKKRVIKSRRVLIVVLVSLVLLLAALILAMPMFFPSVEPEIMGDQTRPPIAETVIPDHTPPAEQQESIETISPTENAQSEETEAPASVETTEPTVDMGSMITFPLVTEEGKLEIESLFQFEGINPDCDYQEGDKIAAIIVRNVSGVYLKAADISMILGDSSQIMFAVSDLPAGKSAVVFSTDNTELADEYYCAAVSTDAVFEEVDSVEGISVTVDGMMVTVTNNSPNELYGIEVYCHGVFDDWYFGGVTYVYTIEKLAAGDSTTITAVDCILGVVDVVRITVNEKN